jgi:hypothetical protein
MARSFSVTVPLLAAALTIAAASPAPQAAGVSGPRWQSHPAIDPVTGDLWFVDSNEKFEGWRLRIARCRSGELAPEEASPLSAPGLEADPYFANGGKDLYFISTRLSGVLRSADLDIWTASRSPDGSWSSPRRLPPPVNSASAEWFPRASSDGWLYFGSSRPGGQGGNDIWRARRLGGKWRAENLGPTVNSADNEYEFEPAPDGRTAIMSADKGIYRLRRSGGSWGSKTRLGGAVNVNGTEIGPLILDRHGRRFLLSRDLGEPLSGEILLVTPAGTVSAHSALVAGCRSKGRG